MKTLRKVVSGGQTGADRGALDAAIERCFPHGGRCPKGRRAEDGRIPECYDLVETATEDYNYRTKFNVVSSNATVVFTHGPPTGGSSNTVDFANSQGRPCLHVDLDQTGEEAAIIALESFIGEHAIECLNVAGSRESKAPGIQRRVRDIMVSVIGRVGVSKEDQCGTS